MVYVGDSVTRRRDSAVHVKVRGRRGGERVSEGGCNDIKRVEVKVKEREQIKEEENKRGIRGEMRSRPPGEEGGGCGVGGARERVRAWIYWWWSSSSSSSPLCDVVSALRVQRSW